MNMQTKWDIVENVVTAQEVEYAPITKSRPLVRGVARAALATTLFVGTILLPASAVTSSSVIGSGEFRSASTVHSQMMGVQSSFARPQGDRVSMADAKADTNVGMSIRRLADLHKTIFRPAEEDAELSGEYSFL